MSAVWLLIGLSRISPIGFSLSNSAGTPQQQLNVILAFRRARYSVHYCLSSTCHLWVMSSTGSGCAIINMLMTFSYTLLLVPRLLQTACINWQLHVSSPRVVSSQWPSAKPRQVGGSTTWFGRTTTRLYGWITASGLGRQLICIQRWFPYVVIYVLVANKMKYKYLTLKMKIEAKKEKHGISSIWLQMFETIAILFSIILIAIHGNIRLLKYKHTHTHT